jgi:hypothetical protein
MNWIIFIVVIILPMHFSSFAFCLNEDFEDGDITSNPAWYTEVDQGAYEIVADPLRSDNLVYKVHGTETGNRSIFSYLDNASWENFSIEFEFMASGWGFHPQWGIATANRDYAIDFGLWLDPSWDSIRLYPSEDSTRLMQNSIEISKNAFSLNTWYKLHCYHNAQTGYTTTELRLLEGNELVASLSYLPTADFSQLADPETLWLGAEEINWQYFDNVNFKNPPEPVSIDIKPDRINPKSKGTIEVAILSTTDFDAPEMVDIESLTFGRTGDEDSLAFCDHKRKKVNHDKLKDLVCRFYTQDTDFQCGDTEGVLKGKTVDGTPIKGSDSVKIIPCKK